MNSNSSIFTVGKFDLKFRHLLIIGILSLAFTISFMIRAQPAEYGFELNEFDPFFNYRATEYIVNNGFDSYFQWHDDLSWYPNGRDVSATSQIMLHITAATTYSLFNFGSSLYDFTIVFPVVFGSLSAIVLFALVRVIGGTNAGLIAALLYSISLPIIIRGMIGWFKSEPLGLFYGFLTLYLLLSGLKTENYKIAAAKLVAGGIFFGFSFASWGGIQFFVIPFGLFIITLPFLRSDNKFLFWSIPIFVITTLLVSIGFERPGITFLTTLGGMGLIVSTLLMQSLLIIKKFSANNSTRNMAFFLIVISIIIISVFAIGSDFLPSASFRYLNAINPFLTTTDPLVDSVSEHATTTIEQSFFFNSILMIFAGLGIWLLFKNSNNYNFKNYMISFTLIFGITGIYVSSTFVRLELFASLAVILLSSIGISILTKEFVSKSFAENKLKSLGMKIPFVVGIIVLLIIPLVFPVEGNVVTITDIPPTILNGGTAFGTFTDDDWLSSMSWLKNNTPHDSIVASWWDYGYWIQTLGERTTLADNATLSTFVIQNIARILLDSPDNAWNSLNDVDADYVLVFVAANKLHLQSPEPLYTLLGGGDESKKQWFMRIGGFDERQFLHLDGVSGTDRFWNETLLGKLIPYSLLAYVDPNNLQIQSETYVPGMVGIYVKDVKYSSDTDGPFKLVYSSPSFADESSEPKLGVFIYEINKDYVPDS